MNSPFLVIVLVFALVSTAIWLAALIVTIRSGFSAGKGSQRAAKVFASTMILHVIALGLMSVWYVVPSMFAGGIAYGVGHRKRIPVPPEPGWIYAQPVDRLTTGSVGESE